MSNPNDLGQNSIDAPEDEDFGDFQHIENDAPEAIQAITAGPNFAYPDLVRIQSASSLSSSNDFENSQNIVFTNNSRSSAGILNPPDVSLSTPSSSSSKTDTLDLCRSLKSDCTKSSSSRKILNNLENRNPTFPSTSSTNHSAIDSDVNKHSVNFNRSKKQTSKTRMDPIPSTSNGITHHDHYIYDLEKQIEQLKIKQELLMRTIRFQNDQISDLMERVIANEPKNDNTIANESSDQRIDTAIRRLESVVESSFSRMNNRIDSLESKINCSLIPSECLKNGELSKPLIDVHLIRLMEQIKEISEHQREQNLQTFTRIIRAALDEII
ncbi:hypothetical protein SSS_02798 [Sarcoptes scabiei]|uniref:Uncharacterized protein n=1 Tax=Sarcoptes scabiei TaxID=52283 RepID=A0A834VFQ0_SARSC|nr:hypothetical protein SSS_02798 [Sarcoptes scabiei]